MKKLVAIVLVITLFAGLCGCKSKEERALERARETARQTEQQFNRALKDYNDLQRDINDYQKALDRLY